MTISMCENSCSSSLREIYLNIRDASACCDDFLNLAAQSYGYIKKNPTKVFEHIHNDYMVLGFLKYGNIKIFDFLLLRDLKEIESDFEIDPSDMGLVISLAISYLKLNQSKRAKQLLERVLFSGYREQKKAKKLIERLSICGVIDE